jgi:hypothetical protein
MNRSYCDVLLGSQGFGMCVVEPRQVMDCARRKVYFSILPRLTASLAIADI